MIASNTACFSIEICHLIGKIYIEDEAIKTTFTLL